jgi:hypothetical protein
MPLATTVWAFRAYLSISGGRHRTSDCRLVIALSPTSISATLPSNKRLQSFGSFVERVRPCRGNIRPGKHPSCQMRLEKTCSYIRRCMLCVCNEFYDRSNRGCGDRIPPPPCFFPLISHAHRHSIATVGLQKCPRCYRDRVAWEGVPPSGSILRRGFRIGPQVGHGRGDPTEMTITVIAHRTCESPC